MVAEAQKAYPNKAGKIELHHPHPKYLGGPDKQDLVPIDAAYHQVITNEFRRLHPYGLPAPDSERATEIITEVYKKFPLPEVRKERMKEWIELRVNFDFASVLFSDHEGKNIGTSVRIVKLSTSDPRLLRIKEVTEEIRTRYGRGFIFGWSIKRTYTKREADEAKLFLMKIKTHFEPTGEELGTKFDLSDECQICGSLRKQVGPLILRKGSIPRKDVSTTIGGELVVSENFAQWFKANNFRGASFGPIYYARGKSTNLQLILNETIDLSSQTIAGVDPFDFSETKAEIRAVVAGGPEVCFGKEVYRCPKGHTLGLNLVSEAFVVYTQKLNDFDTFASSQNFGVKRGLLRPQPVYICSPAFKKKFEESRLTGADFEVAHVSPQSYDSRI